VTGDLAATLRIFDRLVGFDTTSRGSNLALIECVETFLAERGVRSRRVENAEGNKANLLALIGPAAEGGVVLSGHTDVVPVDGQTWTSDPWRLVERDGKLYARGAADMKAFLALALSHVDHALEAGLKRPIILAFSYDEEIGCLGAPGLISTLIGTLPKPEAVIVGEPTGMRVVSAHKGISSFRVVVEGREAHSSQVNQGVSAIMEALKLMQAVADLAEDARARADRSGLFSPPGATLTIGRVEGGTALNILAKRCEFGFDLRSPDAQETQSITRRFTETASALDEQIKARAPEGGVVVTPRSVVPPLRPARDSAAEVLARALTGDNAIAAASYAAEAGLFQQAGIPAVLCGPGSILQAHQPDEWIAIDQLEQGARFMRMLIQRLAA
jgi:acetylornithine deacetylase